MHGARVSSCALLIVAALFSSLAGAAPAGAAALAGGPSVTIGTETGISIPADDLLNASVTQLDSHLDRVLASGASWLRVDVPWSWLEWVPGQIHWERVDRVVNAAVARDLRVLGVVGTMSPTARPAGTDWRHGPTTDAQRAAFAAFAGKAASRYLGRVSAWEVWNEPNLDQFWHPRPSASDYAKLLNSTYPAIKAAAPSATVVTGGAGGFDAAPDVATGSWYQQLYAQVPRPRFDAVGVHPYPNMASPGAVALSEATAVRTVMDAHGDGARQLWGTEAGAPTGGPVHVSEADQAKLLEGTFATWQTIANHGPLFWFTMRDTDTSTRAGSLGLHRLDGTPKPAYNRLRIITAQPDPIPVSFVPTASARVVSNRLSYTGGRLTTSVDTQTVGALKAAMLLTVVRDQNGRNFDIGIISNAVLTGAQTFSATRIGIPPGTYTYYTSYKKMDGTWTTLTPNRSLRVADFAASASIEFRVADEVLVVNSQTVHTAEVLSGTFNLKTTGTIRARLLLIAVRDRNNRNYDIGMASNVTLSGNQTFSGRRSGVPAGSYTYWIAYKTQDGVWRDLNTRKPVTTTSTPAAATPAFPIKEAQQPSSRVRSI